MESTELIQVVDDGERQYVDARTLHDSLHVSRDFATWIKDRIEKYDFQEPSDYKKYSPFSGSGLNGGQNRIDYNLSIAMAKELAIVENTDQGREIRQYLIKIEIAWNTPEMVMARALQCSNKAIADYKRQIDTMKPKAEVYDKIADSSGLKTIQEVASILGIGPNILFSLLRDNGIFKRDNGVNIPKSQYCENGYDYFRPKEEPYTRAGANCSYTRIFVTPKGEIWLTKFLNELQSKGEIK